MTDERLSIIQYYEKLPVAVYICDRNDELVEYNAAAASLFGILPQTGRKDWYPALEVYDQENRHIGAVYKPITTEIKINAGGARHEIRFRLPDGSDRHILVSSVAVRDNEGNYDGAIHTLSDITVQRRFESQQALLASIIESTDDAIITKDLNGMITSWNPAAEHLFGYAAKEAIGRHISLIIPEARRAEANRIIEVIIGGKKIEHFETVRRARNGTEIPISLTVSPIRNMDGTIIGASKIARDITRQKLAEKELLNYTAHLEEMVAKRTEELDLALRKEKELGQLKSRFVSMASHEFRTPLSAVKLSASLVEKYAEPYQNQNIEKHIGKIKKSIGELSTILGDFLSLEKLESGKIIVAVDDFNLEEFCSEMAAEMQLLAKPGQQLLYAHSGTTPFTRLDQQLIKHCLYNLLSNAIKYSGENTVIHFDTWVNDMECRMSVIDQGIGIPEADQQHLFSAFFRAGNTGNIQGTGLGLNIVSRYTQLMQGTVSFESKPAQGTTFTLSFPVSAF